MNELTCKHRLNWENHLTHIETFEKAKKANVGKNEKPSKSVKASAFWILKTFDAAVKGILFRLGNNMSLYDENGLG
ncbi:MAG: hypothetical protein QXV01_03660 [Candidatus Bathyarchaeia archaeon]